MIIAYIIHLLLVDMFKKIVNVLKHVFNVTVKWPENYIIAKKILKKEDFLVKVDVLMGLQ